MRACRLKLPAAERARLVDELLRAVGLLGAASTAVGTALLKGISGGQRRRLSVACEMLVSPSIIFLDEPTSGASRSRRGGGGGGSAVG